MKKRSLIKLVIFSLLGAGAGFAYYFFVGCQTNHCPITSNPFISIIYGFIMGFILGFDPKLFKATPDKNSE